MANANGKLNRAGGSHSGFLRMPYNFMRLTTNKNGKPRKLSETELTVCAAVYSLQKKDEDGTLLRPCDFTYDELVKRYRLSRSSVARTIRLLSDNKLIAKGEKTSTYTCDLEDCEPEQNKIRFLKIEDWIRFSPFALNGQDYYLTNKEARVLSYLISLSTNVDEETKQKQHKTIYGSASFFARRLNISPTTASSALYKLKDLGVLRISGKARNGACHAWYKLKWNVLDEMVKAYVQKRRKAKAEKDQLDEKNRRERFYAERHQKALEHADYMQRQAERDEGFRTASATLRRLDVSIARAETFNLPDLASLRKQYQEAQALRAQRMAILNIDEEDLSPQWICTKCSDTGFRPDGRACNCYEPRRQT